MKKRWIALGGIISVSIPAAAFVVLSMKSKDSKKKFVNIDSNLKNLQDNHKKENTEYKSSNKINLKVSGDEYTETKTTENINVENISIDKQKIIDDFAERKVDLTPINISEDDLETLTKNLLKAEVSHIEPLGNENRTAVIVTIRLYSILDDVKPKEYKVVIDGFVDPNTVEAQDAINHAVTNNKITPIIKDGSETKMPSEVEISDLFINGTEVEKLITRTIINVTPSGANNSTSVIATIEVNAKDKELKDIKVKKYEVEVKGFTDPKVIQARKRIEWINKFGMPPTVKAGSRNKIPKNVKPEDFNLDLITNINSLFYENSIEIKNIKKFATTKDSEWKNLVTKQNDFGKFALNVIKTLNNQKEDGLPGIFVNITSDDQPAYKVAIDFSDLIYQNNIIFSSSWTNNDALEKTHSVDDFNNFLSKHKLKIKDNKLFIKDDAILTDKDYQDIGYLLFKMIWPYLYKIIK